MTTSERDRRVCAFVIDRVVSWSLDAVVLAVAYEGFLRAGRWLPGLTVAALGVLAVSLGSVVVLGTWGVSAGKALVGLRVVSSYDGRPIGVRRAVLRTGLLGLATLPTLGLGVVALAWTALVDPAGRRRGWHDVWAGSVVVDLRPTQAGARHEPGQPVGMVNLTTAALLEPTLQ